MRRCVAVACLMGWLAGSASALTTWLVSNDPLEHPDFTGVEQALMSPLVVDGDTVVVSAGLGPYRPIPGPRSLSPCRTF